MRNLKIKNSKQLFSIISRLKKEGKKIVTFSGSFDVLHYGHIKSLEEAKKLGDVLIILLNSDKSIKTYKGPNRPIIPELHRAEMLAAIEFVDYIYIFDEINVLAILDKLKPSIHANAENWGKDCIERLTVELNGGRIYVLKTIDGYSTSSLIKRIIENSKKPTLKAVFIDRDGTINDNKLGFTYKISDFNFLPGVIKSLSLLSKSEFKIIIITNQSGIGRKYFKESDFKILNNWMLDQLKKNQIKILKVYYCPHHPEQRCSCRKPNYGLLLKAVNEFGISLNDSWVVGDDQRDIIMARLANVKSIKIGPKMNRKLKLEPHYYVNNLAEAINIITQK